MHHIPYNEVENIKLKGKNRKRWLFEDFSFKGLTHDQKELVINKVKNETNKSFQRVDNISTIKTNNISTITTNNKKYNIDKGVDNDGSYNEYAEIHQEEEDKRIELKRIDDKKIEDRRLELEINRNKTKEAIAKQNELKRLKQVELKELHIQRFQDIEKEKQRILKIKFEKEEQNKVERFKKLTSASNIKITNKIVAVIDRSSDVVVQEDKKDVVEEKKLSKKVEINKVKEIKSLINNISTNKDNNVIINNKDNNKSNIKEKNTRRLLDNDDNSDDDDNAPKFTSFDSYQPVSKTQLKIQTKKSSKSSNSKTQSKSSTSISPQLTNISPKASYIAAISSSSLSMKKSCNWNSLKAKIPPPPPKQSTANNKRSNSVITDNYQSNKKSKSSSPKPVSHSIYM
jgi:hypothetical protein